MPHCITFARYTQKGIENIRQSPSRIDAAKSLFESHGGKMKELYLTLGRYDFVVVAEFPNDEACAKATLAAGSQGNIHTETLRAFTEEEYRKMLASLG
jgi:uncharacterized protein with GYD domain